MAGVATVLSCGKSSRKDYTVRQVWLHVTPVAAFLKVVASGVEYLFLGATFFNRFPALVVASSSETELY